MKLVGDRQCSITADNDERVEAEIVKGLHTACGVVDYAAGRNRIRERVPAIGRAEDRAAAPQNARHVQEGQRPRAARVDQSSEPVLDADDLEAAAGRRLDDGTDDGIEARRVSPAGQQSDAHA